MTGVHDEAVAFEHRVQLLERGGWFTTQERKREALNRLIPLMLATRDPELRQRFVARAAEKIGVPSTLMLEVLEGEYGVSDD